MEGKTEVQKLKRKKNILIITFMFLLVVFVCLMCYIFIYVKLNPPKEYLDPSTIEIKTMLVSDYQTSNVEPSYTEITESTEFKIIEQDQEHLLKINENKQIIKSDTNEVVEILLNETDINNNIKLIYQKEAESLILTEDGKLYRLLDINLLENNKLNVGQILSDITIKNIANLNINADSAYVLTNDNKMININTREEYNNIIRELTTDKGVLYVYDDYSITFEKGKVLTTETGETIKFNVVFENKLVDTNGVVYEIDFLNKALTTSSLGNYSSIGYAKTENNIYNINIETNTGNYNFESSYYYLK